MRMSKRTLIAGGALAGVLSGLPAAAQVLPVPPPPAPDASAAKTAVSVESLMTTLPERVGSSISFSFAVSDVADYKAPSEIGGIFSPNPDATLSKGTFTITGSALARSVAELNTAYANAKDYKQLSNVDRLEVPTIGDGSLGSLIAYFSRTRGIDRVGRFVSGLVVAGSIVERAELDFGAAGAPDTAGDRTKFNFDVTFEPSAMFVSAAEKKLAFEAMTHYLKLGPAVSGSLASLSGCAVAGEKRTEVSASVREACLQRLAGLRGSKAWWATAIPTVKLESIDEFDYAVVGGQPVLFPESSREGSLQNLTLTWNLLKVIKPSAARVSAVAAQKALDELADTIELLAVQAIPRTVNVVVPEDGFIAHQLESPAGKLAWSRDKDRAWDAEAIFLTADGMLVGKPRCPASGCRVHVVGEDKAGRKHPLAVTMTAR